MPDVTAPPVPLSASGERKSVSLHDKHLKIVGLWAAVLLFLFIIYLPTLLTQINGSSDPYAEDVAEIQTALNLWGTLHATGYPLYAMLGGAFVTISRLIGFSAAAAPCLYSMAWGFVALSLFYGLIVKLTERPGLAAAATLLLGLTRGVWAYSVVAKPYMMTLAFCVLLLAVALWPNLSARRRIVLLALVGGFAVAHHRMIAFMALGLLVAVLTSLLCNLRRALPTLIVAVPIFLIGFIPYVYLPIRATAHGVWVYGDPSTLQGFWNEFMAVEANHLFQTPTSMEAWFADARDTLAILFSQVTPVGALIGVAALFAYLIPGAKFSHQHAARIAALCGVGFVAFLLILHRVVMPQAVMVPVVMLLLFVIALMADHLLTVQPRLRTALPVLTAVSSAALITLSFNTIYSITHDDSSLRMIALAKTVPRDGSVFMLPWSTSYNAVAFSKYVTGENADLPIADHKANFKAIADQGHAIYTQRDTFYRFPLSWWDGQIGRSYLSSPLADLIRIRPTPDAALGRATQTPIAYGITLDDYRLSCDAQAINLAVTWSAAHRPEHDLSVFIHLMNQDGQVLATGDVSAPIYGWYPTTRWSAGASVLDSYAVPHQQGESAVVFGMYEQTAPGKFTNYGETTVPLTDCKPGS